MKVKNICVTRQVQQPQLACSMKSGSLAVLATPAMIAWMEEAACLALELDEGQTSVGTYMAVSHDAASPLGAEIEIHADVEKVEGRKIDFKVSAYMKDVCIGKGIHSRVVVNSQKFLDRCYANNN